MLIVDSQIHIWQNGKMSAHHRQIPTYSVVGAIRGNDEQPADVRTLCGAAG